MNIFYLDHDQKKCAQMHTDRHCVKMILEYAQLLCTTHHVVDRYLDDDGWVVYENEELRHKLYKETHIQHPSAIWTRKSTQHYNWLYKLFCELCDEYTYRYNKVHKSDTKLREILKNPPKLLEDNGFVQPYQAMPMVYKMEDSIDAYRLYYNKQKRMSRDGKRSKWTGRDIPQFMMKVMKVGY